MTILVKHTETRSNKTYRTSQANENAYRPNQPAEDNNAETNANHPQNQNSAVQDFQASSG
jgi:hypothetical protein